MVPCVLVQADSYVGGIRVLYDMRALPIEYNENTKYAQDGGKQAIYAFVKCFVSTRWAEVFPDLFACRNTLRVFVQRERDNIVV